jgi:ADP-ribose pyrophosphatase
VPSSRPRSSRAPDVPSVRLHQLEEDPAPDPRGGFLRLHRVKLAVQAAENGVPGEPVVYDFIGRKQIDAAVIVAHCEKDGERHVYLRSALRPPLALRPELGMSGAVWELPAGLIDEGESPAAAAARELGEELGFERTGDDMKPLGSRIAPFPAAIAELQYLFCVEVDPATRRPPREDGVLEQGGAILLVPLTDALSWTRNGDLYDAKTEIGLRRLAELGQ